MECNIPVKDMLKLNRVIGTGTPLHKFIEINRRYIFLPCIYYQFTQTDVCLLSPHNHHQMHGSHSVVHGNQLTIHFPFHEGDIPVDLVRTNLPVVHNSFVTEHQKREIGLQTLVIDLLKTFKS